MKQPVFSELVKYFWSISVYFWVYRYISAYFWVWSHPWEPPEQVIKVSFKTNNSFNSIMMASFLPVIVSKKSKQ